MNILFAMLEALMFAFALSMDAFVASFAYGNKKIKIPFLSVLIIVIICSLTLGLSLISGELLKQYIPAKITARISFVILFVIGLINTLNGITKAFIRKHNNLNKVFKFSLFNFRFILSLCADPEQADRDKSKTISAGEATSLAIALSLDGFAIGLGAAIGNANALAVFITSAVINAAALTIGSKLGNRLAQKDNSKITVIGGILLMFVAITKLW